MNRTTLDKAIELNNRILSIHSTLSDLRDNRKDLVLFDRATQSIVGELDADTLAIIVETLVNKENVLKQEFASL